ncbi:MAG: menaquinone biosynthesis protein [Nitrospinota bacterium]|nr:menaquinone biosynthesis protein [Nitrospinota bacterium]
MSGKKLKFGMHDFLNAQPLLIPLREKEAQLGVTMVTGSPAELAGQLQAGQLDLAMIPSIEYLRNPLAYRLLPGIAVASRGPVNTVLFVSQKPLEEVQSVALDARSRTSAALLQVLFGDVFPWNVFLETSDPDPAEMLKEHDASLIIGDPAFRVRASFPNLHIYDLSELWFEQTGKTFVHAVVAVRQEIELDQEFLVTMQEVKGEGMAQIESIAQAAAKKLGIAFETCRDYLENKIIYDLGKEEMIGLQHFRDVCFEKGLLEQKEMIKFVQV